MVDLRETTERIVSTWQNLNLVLNDAALLADVLYRPDLQRQTEYAVKDNIKTGEDSVESFTMPYYGAYPDMEFFLEKLTRARELLDELKPALIEWSQISGREPFANSIPVVLKDFRQELELSTMDAHRHAARHVFDRSEQMLTRWQDHAIRAFIGRRRQTSPEVRVREHRRRR